MHKNVAVYRSKPSCVHAHSGVSYIDVVCANLYTITETSRLRDNHGFFSLFSILLPPRPMPYATGGLPVSREAGLGRARQPGGELVAPAHRGRQSVGVAVPCNAVATVAWAWVRGGGNRNGNFRGTFFGNPGDIDKSTECVFRQSRGFRGITQSSSIDVVSLPLRFATLHLVALWRLVCACSKLTSFCARSSYLRPVLC